MGARISKSSRTMTTEFSSISTSVSASTIQNGPDSPRSQIANQIVGEQIQSVISRSNDFAVQSETALLPSLAVAAVGPINVQIAEGATIANAQVSAASSSSLSSVNSGNSGEIIIRIQYKMENGCDDSQQQQPQPQLEVEGLERETESLLQQRNNKTAAEEQWKDQLLVLKNGSSETETQATSTTITSRFAGSCSVSDRSIPLAEASAAVYGEVQTYEPVEYCEVLEESAAATSTSTTATGGAIPKKKGRRGVFEESCGSSSSVAPTNSKQAGPLRNAFNRFLPSSSSSKAHKSSSSGSSSGSGSSKERKRSIKHSKQTSSEQQALLATRPSVSSFKQNRSSLPIFPNHHSVLRTIAPAAVSAVSTSHSNSRNNNNNNNRPISIASVPQRFNNGLSGGELVAIQQHSPNAGVGGFGGAADNHNHSQHNNSNNTNQLIWPPAPHVVVTLRNIPGFMQLVNNSASLPAAAAGGPVAHSQVDFVHILVPDLQRIFNTSYYWGKIDRYKAESLLEGKPEGTFLLRDSAQDEFLFSVTFRKYERSLHARIEQNGHRFSFDCHDPGVFTAPTVTGLLDHYKDPSCVMFFEPMLTTPLHRNSVFSLQELCRATIVSNVTYDGINELELPAVLKSYLKVYHYKQKLRVRPFELVWA